MWLLRMSLLLVTLAGVASGCASQPYYCPPPHPPTLDPRVSEEIARCEATGMSYDDCCDNHPGECG